MDGLVERGGESRLVEREGKGGIGTIVAFVGPHKVEVKIRVQRELN